MKKFSLSRAERLRGTKTIGELFSSGTSGFAHPLRYVYLVKENPAPSAETNDASKPDGGEQTVVMSTHYAEMPFIAHSEAGIVAMFSVPKKIFKKANKRNLVRRRIKEALRLNKGPVAETAVAKNKTVHIAFIYCSKDISDYKTISNGIERILKTVRKSI